MRVWILLESMGHDPGEVRGVFDNAEAAERGAHKLMSDLEKGASWDEDCGDWKERETGKVWTNFGQWVEIEDWEVQGT